MVAKFEDEDVSKSGYKLGGLIKTHDFFFTQNWFACGIVSMLSCANIIFLQPNWCSSPRPLSSEKSAQESAKWDKCKRHEMWLLQKARVFFTAKMPKKKFEKKKSISWPSKKAVFHYVCKNKKSYDKNWVKVRSTKLSKLITWKKTPGTSKIKRYPRGRDSEGMHFTDFAAGEGSSNSSLKTHRRIIQSLPIFLQPSICWFTAMPGTHGCGAYVGSELFDDPSRGLGWRKW